MKSPRRVMWLVPLTLVLVAGGVALGLSVQRLASDGDEDKPQPGNVVESREEKPNPGKVVRSGEGKLSDLQKEIPFTLYAPRQLPEGFIEGPAHFEEKGDGTIFVISGYRSEPPGTSVMVSQTNAPVELGESDWRPMTLGDKTVLFRRNKNRSDIVDFDWQEGDTRLNVGVLMGEMDEKDVFPIIQSFAPVTAEEAPGP